MGDAVVDMAFPDVHQMSTTSGGMSTTGFPSRGAFTAARMTCSRSRGYYRALTW